MAGEAEPAKLLLPYLQRADELQKHDPLVAYYCRLYAMERGLKIPPKERTKTTSALLVSLIKQLEKDKKSIKLGPEDNLYIEGFASNVFAKADKQDRAGRADLSTAKTFYAASIFFEILSQFGEPQPDIEQKQKYALWKAADIRKALKEGRRPEPGPPGGESDITSPSSSPTSTHDLGPSETFPSSQPGGIAPSQQVDKDESFQAGYPGSNLPPQHEETANPPVLPQAHSSASSYPNYDYSSTNFHQPSLVNKPEMPTSHEPYHHQTYLNEQQSMPQNYYSHENPTASYTYPNFQSYPSFNDSTLPTAPSHQPSYYHSPDASYTNHSTPSDSNYPSKVQYDSVSHNGNHVTTPSPPAATYNYDVNYQPPAEKIAEAHKAARFAVGALAFDDVTVAVEHLRRSLELLTNPSAQIH